LPTCEYKHGIDFPSTIRFECNEPSVTNSIFCIFHDKDNYAEHEEKVTKRFRERVLESISQNKPLECVGYYLPWVQERAVEGNRSAAAAIATTLITRVLQIRLRTKKQVSFLAIPHVRKGKGRGQMKGRRLCFNQFPSGQKRCHRLLLNRELLYFQKHVKDAVIFIMVLRQRLHLLPIMSIFDQTIPYFCIMAWLLDIHAEKFKEIPKTFVCNRRRTRRTKLENEYWE
jgi:hypothetical protein